MRGLLAYLCLVAASLLMPRVGHAQNAALPSIVLTAAPDVPVGLVARVRGELTAAGLPLGAGLQTGRGSAAKITIVIRQTGGELIASLEATDVQGTTQSRVLSVPFVPGDAADVAEAGSELAVRTAEVLRTQLRSQTLDLEAVFSPLPTPSAQRAPARLTVKTTAASPPTAGPPWLIAAGAGFVSGLISGQTQIASEVNVAHVWRSGFYGGLGFLLPFTNASLSQKQGSVSAEAYLGTVDAGIARTFRRRWRASCFGSAGLARTEIAGNGVEPFLSNRATSYAFVAAAGGNLGVTIAPNLLLLLQARLMTLQPRAGIRVADMNSSTGAWVLPAATVALGVSW